MTEHFLSQRVRRDREAGKKLLRKWHIESARYAWWSSVKGFFVRLILFGSLGIFLLGLALWREL